MGKLDDKVLVGNVVMYPGTILQCLVKSHYWLTYNPEAEKITLNVNDGSGGQVLFEIRNAPHESAAKLAEGLRLVGEGPEPLVWNKWNPSVHLYYDGSQDAETLRLELLKVGMPHTVSRDSQFLGLAMCSTLYRLSDHTVRQILGMIREMAERYKEQLSTKP